MHEVVEYSPRCVHASYQNMFGYEFQIFAMSCILFFHFVLAFHVMILCDIQASHASLTFAVLAHLYVRSVKKQLRSKCAFGGRLKSWGKIKISASRHNLYGITHGTTCNLEELPSLTTLGYVGSSEVSFMGYFYIYRRMSLLEIYNSCWKLVSVACFPKVYVNYLNVILPLPWVGGKLSA